MGIPGMGREATISETIQPLAARHQHHSPAQLLQVINQFLDALILDIVYSWAGERNTGSPS